MHDIQDERGVPISTGIPKIVMWAGVAGIVLIFIIAGMVVGTSMNNHVWPADDTLKIKL